jgi:glycosyltransferase involved in cell wall biosynthesis
MRVSLVIPNRNNARFLRQCLESALAQTRLFDEIIVVDDASEDNSVEVVRSFAEAAPNLKLMVLSERMGVSVARDTGIRAASSSHVTTLDADDFFWNPRKNELECQLIEQVHRARPVIAFSDVRRVEADGTDLGSVAQARTVHQGAIFWPMLLLCGFIPRDFTFSREAYFRAGGYDPQFGLYEDWDLKLRFARFCDFVYTGNGGVAYRQHEGGLSRALWRLHFTAMRQVVRKNTLALRQPRRSAVRVIANWRILWFHRGRLKPGDWK